LWIELIFLNDEKITKMKLAEGLLLRADLIKKIEHLVNRVRPLLVVADDKQPQEDPVKLLAQIRKTNQDLNSIIVRINKTNNETYMNDGLTLMEGLAKRDALKLLSEKLRNIREWSQIDNRNSYGRQIATVNINDLQIEIDQTGRYFREIDSKIQELNWLTELKE
jgi:hypothetical protein